MNCPKCESVLLVDVFGTSNPIRCASCGGISLPANEQSTEVNRYAWRSLWLGLSSILLLFLTGLPAIWYGVRSLLQMRFVRGQKNDRKAAAAGITLGVFFGIFGTALVVVIGGFILMIMTMIQETNDPIKMNAALSSVGSIDVPEDFVLVETNGFQGQFTIINWRDGTQAKNAEGRIRLVRGLQKMPSGKIQISRSRDDFELHKGIKVDSDKKNVETLSWTFAGRKRDVEKTTEPTADGAFNTIRYQAKQQDDEEKFGYTLIISVRDSGKYSEEDIQKIFESFQPVE